MHIPAEDSPMRSLAVRCLADVDAMADAFVREVSDVPPYDHGIVATEDLRTDARQSIELLVRLVGGLPVTDPLAVTSGRIGRERARAGVPLQALLQGVRLDLKLLWSHFIRSADDAEKDVLLASAGLVWAAVEEHTLRIQAAYLAEEASVAREQSSRLEQLFRQLMATSGLEARVVDQLRAALRARADGGWVVARCRLQDHASLADVATRLAGAGTAVCTLNLDGWPVLIAQLPAGVSELPSSWLRQVRCGVSLAASLRDVPAATLVAGALAAVLTDEDDGPRDLRDAWLPLVVQGLGELDQPLARRLLRDLLDVSAQERQRLVETARVYLGTGSVTATSASLYCHRNTVLQRLNRLRSLTGFDLTIPEQAAAVSIGLHVLAVSGTTSSP